jgi:hypothetical protein
MNEDHSVSDVGAKVDLRLLVEYIDRCGSAASILMEWEINAGFIVLFRKRL